MCRLRRMADLTRLPDRRYLVSVILCQAIGWHVLVHSHLLGKTGSQVNQGPAGLIYVEDDEQNSLNLPSEFGVDDLPYVM